MTAGLALELPILQMVRVWVQSHGRLEIHVPFENIPHERRNQVTLAVKLALSMATNIMHTERTYDSLVALQSGFVEHVMCLPTIMKYLLPLLDGSIDL